MIISNYHDMIIIVTIVIACKSAEGDPLFSAANGLFIVDTEIDSNI